MDNSQSFFPYPKNNFVETTSFEELKEKFKIWKAVCLLAESGCGKSTLAIQYGNLFKEENYKNKAHWINSNTRDNFDMALRHLAHSLAIDFIKKDKKTLIEKCILQLNDKSNKHLIVFDDVKRLEVIQEFIEKLPKNVYVLITTSNSLVADLFETVNVNLFDYKEAIKYIKSLSGLSLNRTRILELVNYFQTKDKLILPYRLEKIVNYLKNDFDFLFSEFLNDTENYEMTIIFNSLKESEYLFDILVYSSFLDHTFIQTSIFQKLFRLNSHVLSEKLKTLDNLSLIEWVNEHGFRVHSITQQQVLRYIQSKNGLVNEYLYNLIYCLNQLFVCIYPKPDEKWQEAASFYNHVIKVIECFQIELHDSNLIKLIAYIYYKLGVFNFYYFVDYEKAEHCFTQKYKLEVETLAAEKNIIYETNKTESLKFIALCNQKRGMYKIAINYFLKANKIKSKISSNSVDVAYLYHCIGVCYDNLNESKTAIEYKLEALRIRKVLYENKDHPEIAKSKVSLAISYFKLGNYHKALEYDKLALEMRLRIYGSKACHPEIAESLYSLGVDHTKLNNWKTAIDYYFKAHDMMKSLGDSKNKLVADCLSSIAICYEKMGNFKDAIEMDKKALNLSWNGDHQNPSSTGSIEPMTRLRNIQVENRNSTHSKQNIDIENEQEARRILGKLKSKEVHDEDDDNDDILSMSSLSTASLSSILLNTKPGLTTTSAPRTYSAEKLKMTRLESAKKESSKSKTSNNVWSYIELSNELESRGVKSRICEAFLKIDATENKNMFENLLLLSKSSRKLFEDFVLRETNYEVKSEDILKFSNVLNDLFLKN